MLQMFKSDGLLQLHLDRVYQKKTLDFKKLKNRVKNLVFKDTRMKRSHSFDYLPSSDSSLTNQVIFKIQDRQIVYQNEYEDYNNEDEKQHINNFLTACDSKNVNSDKMHKNSDIRKSINQPLQGRDQSFMITSANNSFARDYNDNDCYSSKMNKVAGKHVTRTPGGQDTDHHFSKVYTRGSEGSNINDQSRYHRRIASEDLILEENSDVPKIEYDQPEFKNFEVQLTEVLKDMRYILTCCSPSSIEDEHFITYNAHAPEHKKQVWFCASEILKNFQKRLDDQADKFRVESELNRKLNEEINERNK